MKNVIEVSKAELVAVVKFMETEILQNELNLGTGRSLRELKKARELPAVYVTFKEKLEMYSIKEVANAGLELFDMFLGAAKK